MKMSLSRKKLKMKVVTTHHHNNNFDSSRVWALPLTKKFFVLFIRSEFMRAHDKQRWYHERNLRVAVLSNPKVRKDFPKASKFIHPAITFRIYTVYTVHCRN